MSRIDKYRDQLLADQKELEGELAAVRKLLTALGEEKTTAPSKSPATPKKSKVTRPTSPPSQAAMDKTLKVIEASDHPLRTKEVAQIAGLSNSLASKCCSYLYREARIKGPKELGTAPGKGKVPLWAGLDWSPPASGNADNGGSPEGAQTELAVGDGKPNEERVEELAGAK